MQADRTSSAARIYDVTVLPMRLAAANVIEARALFVQALHNNIGLFHVTEAHEDIDVDDDRNDPEIGRPSYE